jgi:hypothetical protein
LEEKARVLHEDMTKHVRKNPCILISSFMFHFSDFLTVCFLALLISDIQWFFGTISIMIHKNKRKDKETIFQEKTSILVTHFHENCTLQNIVWISFHECTNIVLINLA